MFALTRHFSAGSLVFGLSLVIAAVSFYLGRASVTFGNAVIRQRYQRFLREKQQELDCERQLRLSLQQELTTAGWRRDTEG